jgi:hypothetical protein
MTTQAARAAGVAGIAAVVLILVAGLLVSPIADAPDTASTGSEIAAHYEDERSAILASVFLYGLGMTLFLVFAAGVWCRLREAEGAPGFVAAIFAVGAVVLAGLIFAGFVPSSVLAYRAPDVASPRTLHDLTFGLAAISGFPTALALVAYAALAERARLSIWTVWIAWVAAIAHIVIAGSFFADEGFFSLEGDVIIWIPGTFFAWIAMTSFALLRPYGEEAVRQPPDA